MYGGGKDDFPAVALFAQQRAKRKTVFDNRVTKHKIAKECGAGNFHQGEGGGKGGGEQDEKEGREDWEGNEGREGRNKKGGKKADAKYWAELEMLLLQKAPEEMLDTHDVADASIVLMAHTQMIAGKVDELRDLCLVCGSSSLNKEDTLYCRDCGECFHIYCVVDTHVRKIPKETRHTWRCTSCCVCQVCHSRGDVGTIMRCVECDRAVHTDCLKPAMKEKPKGGWKCNDCMRCVGCGARVVVQHIPWQGRNERNTHRKLCVVCLQLGSNKTKAPKCSGDVQADEEEHGGWGGGVNMYVLATQEHILEAHFEFEEYLRDRLNRLERKCDAMYSTYYGNGASSVKSASQRAFGAEEQCAKGVARLRLTRGQTAEINMAEFEELARHMTVKQREAKCTAMVCLTRHLTQLQDDISTHKYQDLVHFFDEVMRTLDDCNALQHISKEVGYLCTQAAEDMSEAAYCSALTGQGTVRPPLILDMERYWAKDASTCEQGPNERGVKVAICKGLSASKLAKSPEGVHVSACVSNRHCAHKVQVSSRKTSGQQKLTTALPALLPHLPPDLAWSITTPAAAVTLQPGAQMDSQNALRASQNALLAQMFLCHHLCHQQQRQGHALSERESEDRHVHTIAEIERKGEVSEREPSRITVLAHGDDAAVQDASRMTCKAPLTKPKVTFKAALGLSQAHLHNAKIVLSAPAVFQLEITHPDSQQNDQKDALREEGERGKSEESSVHEECALPQLDSAHAIASSHTNGKSNRIESHTTGQAAAPAASPHLVSAEKELDKVGVWLLTKMSGQNTDGVAEGGSSLGRSLVSAISRLLHLSVDAQEVVNATATEVEGLIREVCEADTGYVEALSNFQGNHADVDRQYHLRDKKASQLQAQMILLHRYISQIDTPANSSAHSSSFLLRTGAGASHSARDVAEVQPPASFFPDWGRGQVDGEPKCLQCGSTRNLKACSKCKLGIYCSRPCQVAGWKVHKPLCNATHAANMHANTARNAQGVNAAGATVICNASSQNDDGTLPLASNEISTNLDAADITASNKAATANSQIEYVTESAEEKKAETQTADIALPTLTTPNSATAKFQTECDIAPSTKMQHVSVDGAEEKKTESKSASIDIAASANPQTEHASEMAKENKTETQSATVALPTLTTQIKRSTYRCMICRQPKAGHTCPGHVMPGPGAKTMYNTESTSMLPHNLSAAAACATAASYAYATTAAAVAFAAYAAASAAGAQEKGSAHGDHLQGKAYCARGGEAQMNATVSESSAVLNSSSNMWKMSERVDRFKDGKFKSTDRSMSCASKGIAKIASGEQTKAKARFAFDLAAPQRSEDDDVCSGSYLPLKLPIGSRNRGTCEQSKHLVTHDLTNIVRRQGGILDKNMRARKAAVVARQLWANSVYAHVKGFKAKGWDLNRIGLLVEAAAVGMGVFLRMHSKLCWTNAIFLRSRDCNLGLLGNEDLLSPQIDNEVRRSLAQVDYQINRDPRICCLCRIVGDVPDVQGRLLYVDVNVFAHVNCLCFSKGVYEVKVQKNMGQVSGGLLCNVQSVVARSRTALCDFCGCPGGTIKCWSPSCCCNSHFACAVLKGWTFDAHSRVYCDRCSLANSDGQRGKAWAPIDFYRLTSRNLQVSTQSLSNVAGVHDCSLIAHVGSLTVWKFGAIKVNHESYHSESAIFPVGYVSIRKYFAPGEMRSKGASSRRNYKCEIVEGDNGPVYKVTVSGAVFSGATSSEAWAAATRRSVDGIEGDYMFGITVTPVARILESCEESKLLFKYCRLSDRRNNKLRLTVGKTVQMTKAALSESSSPDKLTSRLEQTGGAEKISCESKPIPRCNLCQQSEPSDSIWTAGNGTRGVVPPLMLLGPIEGSFGEVFVHDLCALFAPKMRFKRDISNTPIGCVDIDLEALLDVERSAFCNLCKLQGASVPCAGAGCKSVFHLPCAEKAGLVEWHYWYTSAQPKLHCALHRDPLCEIFWAGDAVEPAAFYPCAVVDGEMS